MHVSVIAATIVSWLTAVFWISRAFIAARYLPRVPDLHDVEPIVEPASAPHITVILPACNEAAAVEAAIRSLLAQSIPVAIIAVDDRSTDATGAILDGVAAESLPPGKSLQVIHVDKLPPGWLGKPHAMALAARQSGTPWLLFTDADILFAPDVLGRALRYAETEADHLVLMPTLILRTPGEAMLANFLEALCVLWWRPWRIADAKTRDSIGIGAFNLIRATAYRALGGFEALRMEVIDDVRLGVEVKLHGFRQRVVFGRDFIRLHWAPGALGMARNLTKNFYAGFGFHPAAVLAAALGLALLCLAPVAGLIAPAPWSSVSIRVASLLSLAMIAIHYHLADRRFSGSTAVWIFTMPIAAGLILYAMLRSMIVITVAGGVTWRGTFYPLAKLRRHAGPLR
jgi:GT2 family glycosyltransferase